MVLKLRVLCAVLAVVALGASVGCDKKTKPEKTGAESPVQVPASTTDSK